MNLPELWFYVFLCGSLAIIALMWWHIWNTRPRGRTWLRSSFDGFGKDDEGGDGPEEPLELPWTPSGGKLFGKQRSTRSFPPQTPPAPGGFSGSPIDLKKNPDGVWYPQR